MRFILLYILIKRGHLVSWSKQCGYLLDVNGEFCFESDMKLRELLMLVLTK